MSQATLAWAAFKNMLRAAARDPVWALICVILSPLRGGRYLLQVGAFILFMLFIIGEIAWKSKAGKTGTFVLFFVLAFGLVGFIAKSVIEKMWGL